MKKALRIILPVVLTICIIFCIFWYLFIYDRAFTRDSLLSFARMSENQGNHAIAAWFYNIAYAQSGNSDEVAIELAEQYKSTGNFTKAEYTLTNAIADGGGVELYIALSRAYVQQDKLLDAVTMLDNITVPQVKEQLAALRPAAPVISPDPGFYSQYISATLTCDNGTVYASAEGQYPSTATDRYTDPIPLKDGENAIYALSIADNGLVSPLSIYGYTVGGVIQKVTFEDPAIETSVREILNVGSDTELYTNDLWTIRDYTVPAKATSYADLKHMIFLEKLTVDKGKAGDFNSLASLVNLTELIIKNTKVSQEALATISSLPLLKSLTLAQCSLSGIAPLSKAAGLVYLDINNNTVRNIDAIASMKNLNELMLQHNAIVDITALSTLTALTKLDVSYNAITSVSALSNLKALTWLDAGVNSIQELTGMETLSSLEYLSLKSNQISNVSALASCTAITELNISSNKITDISSLSALTQMLYFDFSYNKVSKLPAFPKKCQLVTITGSHNQISSLESLGGLRNLNKVYMDYNTNISSVKALADCPVLIEVNVYGTKVKNVSMLTDQSIIVNYKPV